MSSKDFLSGKQKMSELISVSFQLPGVMTRMGFTLGAVLYY